MANSPFFSDTEIGSMDFMSLSLIFKLYASAIGPMVFSLAAYGLSEKRLIAPWILAGMFVFIAVLSFYSLVQTLHKITAQRQHQARSRYLNQDYLALKRLFLARPTEAALFIDVAPRDKTA